MSYQSISSHLSARYPILSMSFYPRDSDPPCGPRVCILSVFSLYTHTLSLYILSLYRVLSTQSTLYSEYSRFPPLPCRYHTVYTTSSLRLPPSGHCPDSVRHHVAVCRSSFSIFALCFLHPFCIPPTNPCATRARLKLVCCISVLHVERIVS